MFPEFSSLSECQFKVSDDIISNELSLYLSLKEYFGSELDFISVDEFFCDNGNCSSYLGDTPLYRDLNHLTLEGSKLLG